MISVIDYGIGNLGSIVNMLKKIGVGSKLISTPEEVGEAEKIILPGVGSFDNAVGLLSKLDLVAAIKDKANLGTPLLGICLGMQLLGTESEEGKLAGLNLIPGKIKRFPSLPGLKIPHMGWNSVKSEDQVLFKNMGDNRFYFVHTYYYAPESYDHSAGITSYGIAFTSYIKKDNIFGVQFHPEKSHNFGMQVLLNFSRVS